MSKDFFGLRENPFHVSPDPRFLHLTTRAREAIVELNSGVSAREGMIIMLTGAAGTGKTILINWLFDWLQQQKVHAALISYGPKSANHLLELILNGFRISYDFPLRGNLLLSLNDWLVERHRCGETPVLIVDDAQELTCEVLEEIHSLQSIETTSGRLLQIVLVGRPELEGRLQCPELHQLHQRITLRCETVPLTCDETHRYIQVRLQVAGATNPYVFECAAMDSAYHFSGGIPQVLNLLCERSLIDACAGHVSPVSSRVVEEAAHKLALDAGVSVVSGAFPAAVERPNSPDRPPAPTPDLALSVCAPQANVGSHREEAIGILACGMPDSLLGALSTPEPSAAWLFPAGSDVRAPRPAGIPAKTVTQLQPKQSERASRFTIVPAGSQLLDQFTRRMINYVETAASARQPDRTMGAAHPPKPKPGKPSTSLFAVAARNSTDSKRMSRSVSKLVSQWNCALEFWWSKYFTRQLYWKIVISAGLAGSVLFVLALHMSVSEPGSEFARVVCGFLGLLLCAVSLGCGGWLLVSAIRTQSRIAAKWSKALASVLHWLRQPTHL